ncbi:hypothetical protein PYCC9005_003295 [Savitreella phatthalungensis]
MRFLVHLLFCIALVIAQTDDDDPSRNYWDAIKTRPAHRPSESDGIPVQSGFATSVPALTSRPPPTPVRPAASGTTTMAVWSPLPGKKDDEGHTIMIPVPIVIPIGLPLPPGVVPVGGSPPVGADPNYDPNQPEKPDKTPETTDRAPSNTPRASQSDGDDDIWGDEKNNTASVTPTPAPSVTHTGSGIVSLSATLTPMPTPTPSQTPRSTLSVSTSLTSGTPTQTKNATSIRASDPWGDIVEGTPWRMTNFYTPPWVVNRTSGPTFYPPDDSVIGTPWRLKRPTATLADPDDTIVGTPFRMPSKTIPGPDDTVDGTPFTMPTRTPSATPTPFHVTDSYSVPTMRPSPTPTPSRQQLVPSGEASRSDDAEISTYPTAATTNGQWQVRFYETPDLIGIGGTDPKKSIWDTFLSQASDQGISYQAKGEIYSGDCVGADPNVYMVTKYVGSWKPLGGVPAVQVRDGLFEVVYRKLEEVFKYEDHEVYFECETSAPSTANAACGDESQRGVISVCSDICPRTAFSQCLNKTQEIIVPRAIVVNVWDNNGELPDMSLGLTFSKADLGDVTGFVDSLDCSSDRTAGISEPFTWAWQPAFGKVVRPEIMSYCRQDLSVS